MGQNQRKNSTESAKEARQTMIDLHLLACACGAPRPAGHPDRWPEAIRYEKVLAEALEFVPQTQKRARRALERRLDAALSVVIERLTPAVENAVYRHRRGLEKTGLEEEDAKQAAVFGIMRAVQKFDTTRSLEFSTYANAWIVRAVKTFCIESLPVKVRDLRRNKKDPAYEESRKFLYSRMVSSLDMPLRAHSSESGSEASSMLDLLTSSGDSPEEIVTQRHALKKMHKALSSLPEKERDVLLSLYYRGEQLSVLAEQLGVSRERVRQISVTALISLRKRAKLSDVAEVLR